MSKIKVTCVPKKKQTDPTIHVSTLGPREAILRPEGLCLRSSRPSSRSDVFITELMFDGEVSACFNVTTTFGKRVRIKEIIVEEVE